MGWGHFKKEANERDHPLNTKQDLNFSSNWQALYYESAVGRWRVGGTLMEAELNTAGIYSGIKGARLIGFLFSES
jgi:hypothetical protein